MKERISALMCTYREPIAFLRKAVESIINQTYPLYEIVIVIDDPSNIELICELEKYACNNKNIKLVKNETNLGLVKSLNKGLLYCTGDYILRMDADDVSELSRLEKQLKYLKSNDLDVVGSWYRLFNENEILKICKMPDTTSKCGKYLKWDNCVQHPTWFVKKSVYDELEGYRDIYACEDYDFLLRALQKNYKIANCPEILMNYRFNPNSISRKNSIEQAVIASYLSCNFRKHKIVTFEKYLEYKNSMEYKMDCQKQQYCVGVVQNYRAQNNLLYKIMSLLKLFKNPKFIRRKMRDIMRSW